MTFRKARKSRMEPLQEYYAMAFSQTEEKAIKLEVAKPQC